MPAEADQAPDLSGVFVSEGEIEGHPSLTILNFSPPAPPYTHHFFLILRINLWPIRHPTQLNMIAFTEAHWC